MENTESIIRLEKSVREYSNILCRPLDQRSRVHEPGLLVRAPQNDGNEVVDLPLVFVSEGHSEAAVCVRGPSSFQPGVALNPQKNVGVSPDGLSGLALVADGAFVLLSAHNLSEKLVLHRLFAQEHLILGGRDVVLVGEPVRVYVVRLGQVERLGEFVHVIHKTLIRLLQPLPLQSIHNIHRPVFALQIAPLEPLSEKLSQSKGRVVSAWQHHSVEKVQESHLVASLELGSGALDPGRILADFDANAG
jgi:hypothetical protein